mgnify:CR=1 FL=1
MRIGTTQIQHCVAVVELLAAEARHMRFADIVTRLEIPKSSAHALLSMLCAAGWVEQSAETGLYRLALRFTVIGQRFLIGLGLPGVFQPILDKLARDSGELARLAIVDGQGLTWIAYAQGARTGLVYQPRIRSVVPLHVTANGRAWLATLPQEKSMEVVMRSGLGKPDEFGPNAIRSMDVFLRELERTRERGYGLVVEEADIGVAAVAAAIQPQGGPAVGTVSVAGPIFRVTDAKIPDLAALVRGAAAEMATLWPLRDVERG